MIFHVRLPDECFRYRKRKQLPINGSVAGLEYHHARGRYAEAPVNIGRPGAAPADYLGPVPQNYDPHPGRAVFSEAEYEPYEAGMPRRTVHPDPAPPQPAQTILTGYAGRGTRLSRDLYPVCERRAIRRRIAGNHNPARTRKVEGLLEITIQQERERLESAQNIPSAEPETGFTQQMDSLEQAAAVPPDGQDMAGLETAIDREMHSLDATAEIEAARRSRRPSWSSGNPRPSPSRNRYPTLSVTSICRRASSRCSSSWTPSQRRGR